MFLDQPMCTTTYRSVKSVDPQKVNEIELKKWLEKNITDKAYRERYLVAHFPANSSFI